MHTDDSGGSGFTQNQVEVDVQGLQDFAAFLQEELDANFLPNRERIVVEHRRGVGFGLQHASADMHLAVEKYHECLAGALSYLDGYVEASQILIAAVHKVTVVYQTAEDLAGARLADVENSFRQAVKEADAIANAARQRASEQRTARLEREGLA